MKPFKQEQYHQLSFLLEEDTLSHKLIKSIPIFIILLYIVGLVILVNHYDVNTHKAFYLGTAAISFVLITSLLILWNFIREVDYSEKFNRQELAFVNAIEDSMSTGIQLLDLKGRILYVNPAFCRIVGWPENKLVNQIYPYPYWVQSKLKQNKQRLQEILSGHIPKQGFELDIQTQDGQKTAIHISIAAFENTFGKQIGWIISAHDISEGKRTRQALKTSQEQFMAVLERLEDAISVVCETKNGLELLFANRKYRELFGMLVMGHEELKGLYPYRYFSQQAVEQFSPSVERWFEVIHRPLIWGDNQRVLMQVARDITTRRKHEEEFARQQEKAQISSRLTTMGEMASSLAHELNQPLTAITNYSNAAYNLLQRENPNLERISLAIQKTSLQSERAGRIISRIREFVKRSEPIQEPIAFQAICDNMMELAEINAKKLQLNIIVKIPESLPLINVDPILIEQVLLNLVKNGLEAMTDCHLDHLIVEAKTVDDQMLQVDVIDFGHGLKNPELVFEPFFSTKSEGLGMGLNICRTIIESHHGRLWATTNPEGGTIFHFTVPHIKTNMN